MKVRTRAKKKKEKKGEGLEKKLLQTNPTILKNPSGWSGVVALLDKYSVNQLNQVCGCLEQFDGKARNKVELDRDSNEFRTD